MPSLQNLGIGSWPRRRATLSPHRVAVEFEGAALTFAQFAARVESLSAWLARQGVGPGDRVAYWGVNHPALLETLFATTRIGAISVLVNARLAPAEAEYILKDSGALVLFFGREQAEATRMIAERIPAGVLVDIDGTGTAEVAYGQLPVDSQPVPEANCGLDDPAVLMYTSGTTGRPKGALLTHGNLFFNDINVLIDSDIRPDEVCLAAAPLFHIAGLNGLVLPTFLKGGTIVVHRRVEPEAIFSAIQDRGVTSMFAVPSILDALAHHRLFSTTDLSSLRNIVVGGAPVPERILRSWAARDVAVQQGYGLTETAPMVLKLNGQEGIGKAGSAGKPQFLVDVRLVAPGGEPARPGEIGEIQTVGPNVIHEYWQRPDATAAAFTDGWFCTGDAAERDEEGYYWIRDRYKDMYVSGGENVYPAEVETALLNVPGVAEAAVVGVPDDQWGEVGKAFVVPDTGFEIRSGEDIREAVAPILSRFKIPKYIEIIDHMPRTSTGKLLKTELRNREG
ncbi:acyl-CoA synthetase [Arthrobacter sunyaminii]|uniref:Long-chain fatty acid--CoA ligase n=1 Tax=Arthrobacter sunyaminii TaxID=2816859 RepID=A0A975S7L8_9MICC|nr:long-chain fatty acid--CoA ligase [Arthrobacter sunyaminii]MBO0908334.1 long-chain fatty acid--CoA ligase [Arthrobacter sunyaminii]QWQ37320.1 long-chain fatty acid--CoA ligase [Arthrobacter sunyaminii]